MQPQKPRGTKTKCMCGSAWALGLGLLAATGAQAAPIQVNATETTAQPGFFTLDFGPMAGTTSGQITSTDYGLEVDPEMGTARLTNYFQKVEPLMIFGFPTGDIIVEVVPGSSTGSYNKETREFTTTELYSVSFTADLSVFGFVSPVVLPSTSTGTVDISTVPGASHVNLRWVGNTDIIPGQEFTYVCQVNTQFTAGVKQIVDLGLQSAVLDLNLTQGFEDQLIGPLDLTGLRLEQRNVGSAARNLQVFIDKVEQFAGGIIPSPAANAILDDANFVLNRIRPRRLLK